MWGILIRVRKKNADYLELNFIFLSFFRLYHVVYRLSAYFDYVEKFIII